MMQLEPGFNQDLLVYGKQGVEEYINWYHEVTNPLNPECGIFF